MQGKIILNQSLGKIPVKSEKTAGSTTEKNVRMASIASLNTNVVYVESLDTRHTYADKGFKIKVTKMTEMKRGRNSVIENLMIFSSEDTELVLPGGIFLDMCY